jgi:hypothetical protein
VCERAVDRRIHARLSIHCHLLVRRPQHQHLSHMAREGASGGTGVRCEDRILGRSRLGQGGELQGYLAHKK